MYHGPLAPAPPLGPCTSTCARNFSSNRRQTNCNLAKRPLEPWFCTRQTAAMSRTAPLSSFITSAPPGELADVTKAIKSILGDDSVANELSPAFQKYNEEQFTTTKLPGGATEVLVSEYNALGDGRYYDIDTQSSFDFDHATGKASAVQSYVLESEQGELVKSLNKALTTHASEHYPRCSHGVYPVPSSPSSLAILTVANKYSPTNYWNGRWRSSYVYDTASGSVTGSIKVDVHYYEDGNVRLLTNKDISASVGAGAGATEVMRKIAAEEKKYQEDLNRAFSSLSEGAFKALRRQLPITRQKIEWEKISGYRLGQDIGGGRSYGAMSSRNRVSKERQTPSRPSGAANPSPNADVLPPYKKPSYPLDPASTIAIRALRGSNLDDIRKHNTQATTVITNSAASINDAFRDHAEYMERRRPKWNAGKSLDEKEEAERIMQELLPQVEEATAKLEESMRAIIDSGIGTQRIEETLDWLRTQGPRQLEEEYQTQRFQRRSQRDLQSQAASQRRRTQNEDGEDEEMDDGPTPGPTPLDGSRIELTGVSELFKNRIQAEKDAYTSLSLTTRYARNNEYREFKKMVHDAKFGDAAAPLGHEDTWFTETGSPAPGVTNCTQRGDLNDDDDIIMDRATISTRCPITFQDFVDPVTSAKCPHTFEKNAILEMVRRGPIRVGKAPAIECPVTGCNQLLTKDDLRSDPILIRKIKRMQQRDEVPDEEEDSDDQVQAPRRDVEEYDSETDQKSSMQL
ncbi:F-actin-capping subunit alpha [Pyrenophora seminiperda CCB06]|uniref:F-actin-capping protein subunit alpha n=1 Tax=Pyrenophora seminiperda CCB06 TaxID=1302712 RepID=A0A3M7M2N0_9PLEO|nr:F-actin-capping subunit alpha [Pyrenophora seminiperda CCB06]